GLALGHRIAERGVLLQALLFRRRIDDLAGRCRLAPEDQAVDELLVLLDQRRGLLIDQPADVWVVAGGAGALQQRDLTLGAARRDFAEGAAGLVGAEHRRLRLVARSAFLRAWRARLWRAQA